MVHGWWHVCPHQTMLTLRGPTLLASRHSYAAAALRSVVLPVSFGFSPSITRCHELQLQPATPVLSTSGGPSNRGLRLLHSRSHRLSSTSAAAMAETTSERKLVLLPVANGSEEMEVVIVADILRRAGADVTLASVEKDLQIVASRKVNLVADALVSACEGQHYDLIVLPGGVEGSARLRDSPLLQKLTQAQAQENRLCAAICAAPAVAFKTWGLLDGLKATCYPSFKDQLPNLAAPDSRVVRDGLVTTSQGPGTCFEFALSLVEQLYGKEKLNEVSKPLVLRDDDGRRPSVQEFNFQDWSSDGVGEPFHVLVPIANGSEEMEVVIIVDILRRAGFVVTVASVEKDLQILASRKVKIIADKFLEQALESSFDIVILPGGMPGAERLRDSDLLTGLLHQQIEVNKKSIGAICAAPAVVLEAKGLLKGKKATSHPAFSGKLSDQTAVQSRVVIDGLTVTSRGPGTAMEFALAIVEKRLGRHTAHSIAEAIVFPYV